MPFPKNPTTNFKDSTLPVGVDLGDKLVTKDYLLEVYGSILENSPASGLIVTPELWVWGQSGLNQSGRNTTSPSSTPVTTFAGGTNWKQVSAGNRVSMAIKTDGTLWVWGYNNFSQLGINNTTNPIPTPVTTFAGGTTWKQVSAGYEGSAAIKTDGTLWVWGRNGSGQLGINAAGTRSTPVTTFAGGTNWKQVSCGGLYMTAIKTDGSLWTWGRGTEGQLGNFAATNRSTPVTTFAGGNTWKQVACLFNTMAAVKTDGTLWTWGNNGGDGSLGINSNTGTRSTPVTTFAGGNTWKQVTMGGFNAASVLAIKTDGTLWGWGWNTNGGLGTNNTTAKLTPVTTFAGGTNWKQVSSLIDNTAAIKTDGSLWTWGSNFEGVLGINNNITRSTPVTTFAGGNDWKSVSANNPMYAIRSVDYI